MDTIAPEGLSSKEMEVLVDCLDKNDLSPEKMLHEAELHLENAREAARTNGMVNVRLAEAIVQVFRRIVADWETIPDNAKKWCLGMVCYFSLGEDEIDDFESPIGFEDDAEVVNACLKIAGREELSINIEDYGEN
ncbi:MAG: hypothetical protein GY866_16100 [Proteobacteria bacterium]|nr:hypothetical protein [Pseudomonadota bacterium]